MEKVYQAVDGLVSYAKKYLGLDERDEVFARNTVFSILGLESYKDEKYDGVLPTVPDKLLKELDEACIDAGLFGIYDCARYNDEIMGALMMPPSKVIDTFNDVKAKEGSEKATEWLYDYSVKSDYVKKSALDANPRFEAEGLIVTINKSKPEFRDPKKAASGNSVKGGYPKCTICRENEGFSGRNKRTLRTVDITLGGKKWFWQFSPYGYFYQHGIAVNTEHTPMHVDKNTFVNLMDFVDVYPHYFIGCNAPLPRIGGSVLAHDHYQGGGEVLPLHKAPPAVSLKWSDYPEAEISVLDWPGTAVRVKSTDRNAVTEVSEIIRKGWVNYENASIGIIPRSEEGEHSAISPTVVKRDGKYEMTIILRNNITTEEYPDGVFHAHPEFHTIKKESIGLIEAQGLFILPGRLETQLAEIENLIVNGLPLEGDAREFELVYEEMKTRCGENPTAEQVSEEMKKELGSICKRILGNTAVFKTQPETVKFLKGLGFTCND
ncbi:MAG: galactose-1-phosphate uridylyltransferase [Clostridia bacterium]|nr:galactose-1-phosphate uridylyltransferase [Clostridia bacterium]